MEAGKILLAGLTGTSLMTLFSYWVSDYKHKNFREPQLFAALEKDMLPCSLKELALPAGWATHYSIGIAWATVYEYLWQKSALKPTITSGIALGGVSGLTAVVAWKLFFIQIHPVSILKDFMRIWCWRM